MLSPGLVLQDRYRVVRSLGEGGMGAVYRAWDLRLKMPVALKEMRAQSGLDSETLSELRQQFHREAAVLARLTHPNLVRVTDYFGRETETYLVMDFVEGESLADLVVHAGLQPESHVLHWTKQLLDALIYCHSQGVVHRDIKPQNIIIEASGRAVLVDFGLVKLWDPSDPHTKTVMRGLGTPEYAPPEQYSISDQHTDPSSDLYSLGATLYHVLSGQAPMTATDRMVAPERFPPLRQLVPMVSPQMEFVVMKALALDRARRWRSAREMMYVLEGGTPPPRNRSVHDVTPITPTSEQVAATPAAPKKHLSGKTASARWVWIAGIVGGGLLLIIAVIVGIWVLL